MRFVLIIWILLIVLYFAIWSDETDKRRQRYRRLAGWVLLSLGPLAIVGYLLCMTAAHAPA